MYGNYQYSLDSESQSAIQIFLRTLPKQAIDSALGGRAAFNLLHELTYAESWSKEPEYELPKAKASVFSTKEEG